jgi:two-component system, NarL family, invasion response regulator UvrY
MSHTPIRIILADNHDLIRETWKLLLQNNPLFQIIADSNSGEKAIELVKELHPDILLLDINMMPLSGFEVAERIAAITNNVKIIALSVNNQPKYAVKMIELGAKAYVTKTSSLEELSHSIIEVQQGRFYICEEIIQNFKTPLTTS